MPSAAASFCFVGVTGGSALFLLSVLFRRKKLRPLFLLLLLTGVSGWASTWSPELLPPLLLLLAWSLSADFSDDDLEERNMGKKWLVFFDSFWGVAGEGVVTVVGLTGVVDVVVVGEVGEVEEVELPCCGAEAAAEAAGTGLDSGLVVEEEDDDDGDVAGVDSAEPDGLVVVVGSVRPFVLVAGASFSASASWHSSSSCWSLTPQSGTSGLSEELTSLVIALCGCCCW